METAAAEVRRPGRENWSLKEISDIYPDGVIDKKCVGSRIEGCQKDEIENNGWCRGSNRSQLDRLRCQIIDLPEIFGDRL